MKTQLRFLVVGLLYTASSLAVAQNATVKLDSVWGCPGQVVEVPVRVYGINELGLNVFTFEFRMDTTMIEPVFLNWDPDRNQGFPMISDWDMSFMQRGSFVANSPGGAAILVTWIDRTFGGDPLTLEDGSILFKLHFRIKQTPIEPTIVELRLANMSYFQAERNRPYTVDRSKSNGHVLAKSVPNVRIDNSTFDNPTFLYGANGWQQASEVSICIDQTLPLVASGAERYEWRTFRAEGALSPHYPSNREDLVLDRADVYNPLFTPREIGLTTGHFSRYHLIVTGYNSDGCAGTDSVRIRVQYWFNDSVNEQPNHIIVDRGEVIDLSFTFRPRIGQAGTPFPQQMQSFRWFPEEMVVDSDSATTKSLPITEPTWFWAEARTSVNGFEPEIMSKFGHGCVRTMNIRVDIRGEMFDGRIGKSADLFCGQPGKSEHTASVAALVEGGSEEKTYTWEFRQLYSGPEPEFSNFNTNSADITFFGTTEVTVRIKDLQTLNQLELTDTLFVETARAMSIHIEMDEASQRQYEIGYCVGMPITFLATVENAGNNYQVFWEVDGYRSPILDGLTAHFPRARAQGSTYRAVLYSSEKCLAETAVYSNVIDPKVESHQLIAVWANNVIQDETCNSNLANFRFTVVNMGTNPLFQIYRNDELLEEFIHTGENTTIERPVQTLNYWDRFNVRFTNTSAQCLFDNDRLSDHRTPNLQTTEGLKIAGVVSDLGGDTVCDSPHGIYTFRLTGMEQFAENTTVIWLLNGKEWGRYEFDETLAAEHSAQLPEKHGEKFVINQTSDSELSMFAQGFPFHINADGFPKVGVNFNPGDSLSVIVITRAMCGSAEGQTEIRNFAGVRPKFVPIKDAVLAVVPTTGLNGCKGGDLSFSATVQNVNFGTVSWFLNDKKVGEGASFTAKNILNNDEVVAVLESDFRCATNLPLRSLVQVIKAHDLPTLTVVKDTIICNEDPIQLMIQTSATSFAWTGTGLSSTTVQNPTATPVQNETNLYSVTVTDANGCQSSETLIVRTAPRMPLTTRIWLTNPADTIICRDKLVLIESEFSPAGVIERRWLRNGFNTTNTTPEISTSTLRDGDAWQLQVAMPTLNTCLPRTAVSNVIEFRVDNPVQTRIVATETTLCPGDSVLLTAIGGAHYRWTSRDGTVVGTSGSVFVKPTVETMFFVEAFGPRSFCFSRDSILISVEEYATVNLAIQLDSRIPNNCETADGVYLFEALPTNPGPLAQYDWYVNNVLVGYTKGNVNFARDLKPGDQVHSVMTADIVSCRSTIATSNAITILARPNIPQVDGHMVCRDEQATLEIKNPQSNVTYFWYSSKDNFVETIGTGRVLSDQPSARYLVIAVAENGCENLDQVFVHIEQGDQPQPRIALLMNLADVQTREPIRFRNESTNWVRAFWTFGDGQEEENHSDIVEHVFTTIQTHPVALRLVSKDDCEASQRMELNVLPGLSGVFVPSAFMPNSPNAEDQVLKVYGVDFVLLRFSVFSMDGKELFTTQNPDIGWNGRDQNGREMPTGNYGYMVVFRASGEEVQRQRSGTAVLIR